MNNINFMDMFSKLMQQNNQPAKQNYETENVKPLQQSDYPEVFFTNNKQSQVQQCPCMQNNQQQGMNPMFNFDSLKSLLPLFLKKGSSGGGIASLLQNLNPNISNIFSALSKKEKKSEEKSDPIIDLSEYTETN